MVVCVIMLALALGCARAPASSPATPATVPAHEVIIQTGASADQQVELSYSLPRDGFVTLVIDDLQGHRVRNLIGAAPRKAGNHTELWDGADEQGNAVPPGEYRWRMLHHEGVGLAYELSYGNPGTPPWATADGRGGWGADHSKPEAAVATKDGMVLGWPMAESGSFLIGIGADGRKQWGLKNRYAFGDTTIRLATDGEYLYVASEQNAKPLMRYYKKLAHAVLYRYRLSDRRPARMGDMDEIILSDQMGGNVRGLALAGEVAYVSLGLENRIAAVSLTTGQRIPERDIPLANPGAIAMDKTGALLVLAGRELLRVDPAARQVSARLSQELEEPMALSVDAAGLIYVSDRGKAQQVKVFDSAGRLVRTIGQAGGRSPRGTHQSGGMYRPYGLAVDDKGILWVMEQDDRPQRVSLWDAATGAFVREYIGACHYGALAGCVWEHDKTMAFGEGVQYRLDYAAKTYTYVATPGRARDDEDIFGRTVVRRVLPHHGRQLTASNDHVQVIGELRNGELHPLAAVGEIDELTRRLGMHTGAIARKIEQLKAAGAKVNNNGFPTAAFIWTDQNGDGIPQDAEFVWKPDMKWGGYWGGGIANDFTVYMQSGKTIHRLPVTRWNEAGAPVYRFETATTIASSGTIDYVSPAPDGMLIVQGKPMQGIDLNTGKTVWTYPNLWPNVHGSHTADIPAPGRLIGTVSITGFAPVGGPVGTLFAMNGNLGQHFLMTSDGLYVAAVLRDWRLARREDEYTIPDEAFGGYFWRDQASGQVYLQAGKSEYRIYRVTGLEGVRRSAGTFAMPAALAQAARARSAERAAPRQNIPRVVVPKLDAPLPLTGALEELPKTLIFTEVKADANNAFRFALAHDRENLYLVYDVTSDRMMVNPGRQARLMFTTGDCVDLMIGADPKADPKRRSGVAGDARLLLTLRDGKPLAVLYKQVDPKNTWPTPFMSPSRAVYFGSVKELNDVKMTMTPTPRGYVVRAAVPLASLDIKASSLPVTLLGDMGVIFGSASGNGARLRLYWANKATAITSDVPSEAELAPQYWGQLQLQ